MSDNEKNVMVESGRASGSHPEEERYRLEREIILEGAQDPANYQMPGNIGTLAEVQQRNAETQKAEGDKQVEQFRESMRRQSFQGITKGKTLGISKDGLFIDKTEPEPLQGLPSHENVGSRDADTPASTPTPPRTPGGQGGPGGQRGSGATGPGGTDTSTPTGTTPGGGGTT